MCKQPMLCFLFSTPHLILTNTIHRFWTRHNVPSLLSSTTKSLITIGLSNCLLHSFPPGHAYLQHSFNIHFPPSKCFRSTSQTHQSSYSHHISINLIQFQEQLIHSHHSIINRPNQSCPQDHGTTPSTPIRQVLQGNAAASLKTHSIISHLTSLPHAHPTSVHTTSMVRAWP